jgi:hypothetical protein
VLKPQQPVKAADIRYDLNNGPKFYRTRPDPIMAAEMAADPTWPKSIVDVELMGRPNRKWFEAITDTGQAVEQTIEDMVQKWTAQTKVNEAHRLAREGRKLGIKMDSAQKKGKDTMEKVVDRVKGVRETRAELLRIARENAHAVRLSNDSAFRVGAVLEDAMKKRGNVGKESQVWLKNILAKTGELADSRDPKVLGLVREINNIKGDTIYDRVEKSAMATRLFEYVFRKLPREQRTSGGFRHADSTLFSTMASQLVQEILPNIFESFKRTI